MAFDPFNSELYIVGASSEVYRLNLEHGRFLSSIESNINESFNVTDFNREV